jgi:hypothetical protein
MTTEVTGASILSEAAGKPADGTEATTDGAAKAPAPIAETPEQKAAAFAAAAEKAALEAAVDEKWAPKLGEGQKLDDASLAEFRELAKKGGFKSGQAQALVEFDMKRQAAAERSRDEAGAKWLANERKTWRESLKTDPDFGGANYDKNLRSVQRAMAKFGESESFKKWQEAGAGDHPEFVKLFARIGATLAEDPGVKSGGKATNGASASGDLQKFFDKSPELFT